jgi:hypothetical protein
MAKNKFTGENQPSSDAKRKGWEARKSRIKEIAVLNVQDLTKEYVYSEIQDKSGSTFFYIELLIKKLGKEALGTGVSSHKAADLLFKMLIGNYDVNIQNLTINNTNIGLQSKISELNEHLKKDDGISTG